MGLVLRDLLDESGVTVRELSLKLDMPYSSLYQRVNGYMPFDGALLCKIHEICNQKTQSAHVEQAETSKLS